ncbi:FliA/WhiG family RNA polymerase sigma factor [Candidatus Contubernalis alkaliaceticus]|uniref:FliA/WhiG family RNA polymerase sigma factor n=1 Tax=Candidatus Contubernalis alkaliaceticus TaxID=338645 RepID=UPI001F4BDF45|nr:FliA/WhiG family RNA polymerase sigma factor [Candidatus Contubernalis alkalaceticus]UNC91765.1 FliA/WhiG family RNA polymerase sigma factor [Candidatus Contubernalis alkalaceticus]
MANYQGYKNSIENRDSYIEKFLPLVNRMAGRLALGLPSHVDRDDLVGSGIMGLLDALEKYNPSKGPMKNYVALRIQGTMLDHLRKMSWLPRTLISKLKEVESAYTQLRGELLREPTEMEVAYQLGLEIKDLSSIMAHVNQKSLLSIDEYLFVGDEGEKKLSDLLPDNKIENNPEESLTEKEKKERLAKAIEGLTEREQLVLHLYYREELTLREIGNILGVSESRVSQLHGRAMVKLRQQLKDG